MSSDHEPRGQGSGPIPAEDWRFSRRSFLQSAAVTAGAAAIGGAAAAAPVAAVAAGVLAAGPEAAPITLNINGKDQTVTVEPRVTLLDACRNHLDITGAKKVCDRATCGACTMHMDGKPVYACTVLAIDAVGRKIKTIEGLGTPEAMTPIQAAFVKNDAQQCGFCTPGFVMACQAFCDSHKNATEDQIRHGLGGNLCRCGTYAGIVAAVAQTAGKGA